MDRYGSTSKMQKKILAENGYLEIKPTPYSLYTEYQ